MLYWLAHILRDRLPWAWDVVDRINAFLFTMVYGRRLKLIDDILKQREGEYRIRQLTVVDVPQLVRFFASQPVEAFTYFRPHAFDENTLMKLARNRAFLAFTVMSGQDIVGYFFLRSFFFGKCYRGYIVDSHWRNRGISKMMAGVMTDVARVIGMRSYGTISPQNMSSMNSSKAVNDVKILKVLKNGDYYVEYV